MRIVIIISLYFLLITGCGSPDKSKIEKAFSALTYPSSEWTENDFGSKPSIEIQELLKKNAPQFFISKEGCKPMDFYSQYVPLLRMRSNKKLKGSRELLKKYERDFNPSWILLKKPNCLESDHPPLYSYSWTEMMSFEKVHRPVRILKYSFTFYKSGLPQKMPLILQLSSAVGDSDKWHYLDIHGAVFYLLNEKNEIFSVLLAQHNHFRSYIIGEDVSAEEAKNICFSKRSNEPYFCSKINKKLTAPTAPNYKFMKWIITGQERPTFGCWDVFPDKKDRSRINYKMEYLSSKDPLITSWNSLGPNLKILGLFSSMYRRSPPGMAIYNTPKLREVWKTVQTFYFDPQDAKTFDFYKKDFANFFNPRIERVFKRNSENYLKALKKVRPSESFK